MKFSKGIVLLIFVVLICGCSMKDENGIDQSLYQTKNFSHLSCIRNAEIDDQNSTVSIHYDVYYDDQRFIQVLISEEEVSSTNQKLLDQYETSYKKIFSVYDGIQYYDNVVIREDHKVTSKTYINYGKVDIDRIMEIEGTEDNVKVTKGKIKLLDWQSFARKYGTTCSHVTT